MDISIFGYKLNLEVLILIGVIYLILIGHTLCGCSRVGLMEGLEMMKRLDMKEGFKMIEGLKMKRPKFFSKDKGNKPKIATLSPSALVSSSALASSSEVLAEEDTKAEEDDAFFQEAIKILNIPPDHPHIAEIKAQLLRVPPDQRETFFRNNAQAKREREARESNDKANNAEGEAQKAAIDAFVQEAVKIMDIQPDNPYRNQFEARLRTVMPNERETYLKNLANEKAQQEAWKVRLETELRAELQRLSPAEREATLQKMINDAAGNPDRLSVLNRISVSYSKKEGFTGANINYGESSAFDLFSDHQVNTSAWSAQNMTVVPGQPLSAGVKQFLARPQQKLPLPEGEIDFFANSQFKPECCPGTYSTSGGCWCGTSQDFNYLVTRGGNNLPYSEY